MMRISDTTAEILLWRLSGACMIFHHRREDGDHMEIRDHGSVDLQNILRVLSEILSDRYKTQITVTAK